MRFSLRTLIVVMLLGGPVCAGAWTIRQWQLEAEWQYRHRFDHCSDKPIDPVAERERDRLFWKKFCEEFPDSREDVEKAFGSLDDPKD
jgi:hypothetical protein